MGKYVLPLTLMFCVVTVQAQSKPVSDLTEVQRKAVASDTPAHRAAVNATWEDPHQKLERMQIANAFIERQLALRRDTEKLLSLAAELKQNVDKTSPNILSMDVIKKAQEIEKLAKSVKDKMRDAF